MHIVALAIYAHPAVTLEDAGARVALDHWAGLLSDPSRATRSLLSV